MFNNIYKTLTQKVQNTMQNRGKYEDGVYYPFAKKTTGNTAGNVGSTTASIRKPAPSMSTYSVGGGGGGGGGRTTNKPSQPTSTPKAVQQYNQPIGPTQPSKPQNTATTSFADYLKQAQGMYDTQNQFYTDSENRRLQTLEEQKSMNEDNARQIYGNIEQDLQGQIPMLEEQFNKYKGRSLEDVAYLERAGARQKEGAEDIYGTQQRDLARTKRDTDSLRERQYAGLGTIDSYGTGSFTQGNQNADNEYVRLTNENLKKKADTMIQIDEAVELARRDTIRKIEDEDIKLQNSIREISRLLRDNSQAREAAIRQAYLEAETAKNDIIDTFESLRIEAAGQRQSFEKELLMAQTGDNPQLSEEFMRTGIPQTMNDIIYRDKNADAYEKFYPQSGAGGEKQGLLNLIGQIRSGNVAGITGYGKFNPVNNLPGADAQLTRNQYEQLKGLLSLENREKLKGSGAISDFESRTLEKAASALGQNLSEAQFRQVLDELYMTLGGQQMAANQNDPLGLGL